MLPFVDEVCLPEVDLSELGPVSSNNTEAAVTPGHESSGGAGATYYTTTLHCSTIRPGPRAGTCSRKPIPAPEVCTWDLKDGVYQVNKLQSKADGHVVAWRVDKFE